MSDTLVDWKFTAEARMEVIGEQNAHIERLGRDMTDLHLAAMARITSLEEALRDTASEAHAHGLVRDHPDLFHVCPNYICRLARKKE